MEFMFAYKVCKIPRKTGAFLITKYLSTFNMLDILKYSTNCQISDFSFPICLLLMEMLSIIGICIFFFLIIKRTQVQVEKQYFGGWQLPIMFKLSFLYGLLTVAYMLRVTGGKSIWGEKKE